MPSYISYKFPLQYLLLSVHRVDNQEIVTDWLIEMEGFTYICLNINLIYFESF